MPSSVPALASFLHRLTNSSFVPMLIATVVALALQSCKMRENNSRVAELRPTEVDDRPQDGRSRFDELVAKLGGEVPYPLQEFKRRAESILKVELIPVMIPFGRSLQKQHADFGSPRIVMSAYDNATYSNAYGEPVANQMFIGFAERAKSLEVISYNDTLGRFEFQVVKKYAKGQTPEIFYAKRNVCLRCHQDAAPIFPPAGWTETNQNPDFLKAIQTALGTAVFQGISIKPAVPRGRPHSDDIGAIVFDSTVRDANSLLQFQQYWQALCPTADRTITLRCRKLALNLITGLHFIPTDSLNISEVHALVEKNPFFQEWRQLLSTHYTTSTLPDFMSESFLPRKLDFVAGTRRMPDGQNMIVRLFDLTRDERAKAELKLRFGELDAQDDPATPRHAAPFMMGGIGDSVATHSKQLHMFLSRANSAIFGTSSYLPRRKTVSISEIDGVFGELEQQHFFENEVFVPSVFIEKLVPILTPNARMVRIAEGARAYPEKKMQVVDTSVSSDDLSTLSKFKTYCGACHGRDGEGGLQIIDNLADEHTPALLVASRQKVAERLMTTAARRMPPAGEPAPTQEERAMMLELLMSLESGN